MQAPSYHRDILGVFHALSFPKLNLRPPAAATGFSGPRNLPLFASHVAFNTSASARYSGVSVGMGLPVSVIRLIRDRLRRDAGRDVILLVCTKRFVSAGRAAKESGTASRALDATSTVSRVPSSKSSAGSSEILLPDATTFVSATSLEMPGGNSEIWLDATASSWRDEHDEIEGGIASSLLSPAERDVKDGSPERSGRAAREFFES
mmetsp:Transcript_53060/g.126240  ORF Transcript_53060/g.126240 Transcript_53060/m.126240 type:complete len:206 (+) Transcript_53060:46-663(+)